MRLPTANAPDWHQLVPQPRTPILPPDEHVADVEDLAAAIHEHQRRVQDYWTARDALTGCAADRHGSRPTPPTRPPSTRAAR